jgi:hypothetical protein
MNAGTRHNISIPFLSHLPIDEGNDFHKALNTFTDRLFEQKKIFRKVEFYGGSPKFGGPHLGNFFAGH